LGKEDVVEISALVLELFRMHAWPGNIRQLLNVMERALIVARGPSLLPEHLPAPFLGASALPASTSVTPSVGVSLGVAPAAPDFDLSIEAAERDQIRKALEAAGGKRMEAARLLGLSRRTLYRKLDKYGIT
jgi:DNA-binding NtrC family response regulator